jgi:squalene synthase HpnC
MPGDLGRAYAACERLASRHYENFPVASRLLPRVMRPHVAAIYAFARSADDFADEGVRSEAERHQLLDDWLARLRDCVGDCRPLDAGAPVEALIFAAVGHTITTCGLPVALFEDLVSAFRQDVTTRRYETWDAVLDYCRRSANPVGRLVLRVAGYERDELDRASDALCSALQLANFWQDLARDWANGRLYVPREEYAAAGARETDLAAGCLTPAWRTALARAAARTAGLFDTGRAVCDGVRGRLRWELRLTWLGGRRILERLEAGGFDPFTHRPSLGLYDGPVLSWRLATWRRS